MIAVALAAFSARARPATADIELLAGGGSLSLSNSREGSAILSLAPMRPGDSVTGTVTIGNTGTLPGDLTLSTSNLVNVPGPGAGALSATLDLLVQDVTNPGSPVSVYSGTIPAMAPVSLGSLAAGASRDYSFRVVFPDTGAGDNAYQGSSMSVQFDWTATNPGDDTVPPETTLENGHATLSPSREARFSFTADEPGSTFECSLDGAAFASCSSPAIYGGLADGGHVFSVRGTDPSGNTDTTPASQSWTIDATAPSSPGSFRGARTSGRLVLSWSAATDQSGIAGYVLYASGTKLREVGSVTLSADVGPFKLSDARKFQVAATDAAGNAGAKTHQLVIVPQLRGVTLAKAKTQLAARGLKPGKITRIRQSAKRDDRRRISILVGNGGLFLDFEMERGADGAMTGYAFPELLIDVVKLSKAGKRDAAHDLFDAHLPLIRYEQQPGAGLAVRKYVLQKRGIISSSAQRRPVSSSSSRRAASSKDSPASSFPLGSDQSS